jgi:hypothetical protein
VVGCIHYLHAVHTLHSQERARARAQRHNHRHYLLLIFRKPTCRARKKTVTAAATTLPYSSPACSFFILGGRRPLITQLQRQCARVCGLVRLYTPLLSSSSLSSCSVFRRLGHVNVFAYLCNSTFLIDFSIFFN